MKICITAKGDNLNAEVEAFFGRSPYFIIYDTENANFEAIKNPNVAASGGAGIQSGQLIVEKNVAVILTGNPLGPKAADVIQAANIKVISGISGTVEEAIKQFQSGSVAASVAAPGSAVPASIAAGDTGNWFGRCMRRMLGRGGRGGNCRMGVGQGRGRNN